MEGAEEIIRREDITKYLKIEKSTLYKMAKEGKVHAVKVEWKRNTNRHPEGWMCEQFGYGGVI